MIGEYKCSLSVDLKFHLGLVGLLVKSVSSSGRFRGGGNVMHASYRYSSLKANRLL